MDVKLHQKQTNWFIEVKWMIYRCLIAPHTNWLIKRNRNNYWCITTPQKHWITERLKYIIGAPVHQPKIETW